MKFGIVSDIHCNATGLRQALALMGDVDELLCLGDCISDVRFSDEVVRILMERDARVVLGNHDVDYLKRLAEAAVERGTVDARCVDWLRRQPESQAFDVGGKRLVMVHATPWSRDYVYPGSKEMKRFAEVHADYVLGGHTHTLFCGRIGRPLVINPGSAGQSRYKPEGLRLSCAVLDTRTDAVDLIEYPDTTFPGPN